MPDNPYPDQTLDGWILTATAAQILNVSPCRVKQFYQDGRLPKRKRGNMNETRLADVLALAKVQRKGGRPRKERKSCQ